MFSTLRNLWQLARAGRVMARYDFFLRQDQLADVPWLARAAIKLMRAGAHPPTQDMQGRITTALSLLGPSYIKLGQFLATRPDVIGAKRAFELKSLQDKLPPFSMQEARAAIRNNLDRDVEELFFEFGEPVAAASIAQVHKARTIEGKEVAVKVLRPGVEQRFARDLDSFFFAASWMERLSSEGRRLRPVAAVAMLDQSMRLELDLRMEASAMSEMAENTKDDPDFRVPEVDWVRTARQVLTTQWIDGTPIAEVETLRTKGFDLVALGDTVIQSFLRHAIRDGFFHADMHQGNLFVDDKGQLVAVDFGITGRLSIKERMFLAEILYGFITRDYVRVSQVHFNAGYVPADQNPNDFAQALRAIGEPILGLKANEISMARLLTQLFEVTGQFNMVTQPQLLLLQKTMVVVEGVARTLNPELNMWKTAEPVVRVWIERKLGPIGKIEEAVNGVGAVARLAHMFPDVVNEIVQAGGVRLDQETLNNIARSQNKATQVQRYALMACAVALTIIAIKLVL